MFIYKQPRSFFLVPDSKQKTTQSEMSALLDRAPWTEIGKLKGMGMQTKLVLLDFEKTLKNLTARTDGQSPGKTNVSSESADFSAWLAELYKLEHTPEMEKHIRQIARYVYSARANDYVQSEDYTTAQIEATKALSLYRLISYSGTECAPAYALRGLCLLRTADTELDPQRQYVKALSDLNMAIKANPDYSDAYYFRAQLHIQRKDFALAGDNIKQALKLAPENEAYVDLSKSISSASSSQNSGNRQTSDNASDGNISPLQKTDGWQTLQSARAHTQKAAELMASNPAAARKELNYAFADYAALAKLSGVQGPAARDRLAGDEFKSTLRNGLGWVYEISGDLYGAAGDWESARLAYSRSVEERKPAGLFTSRSPKYAQSVGKLGTACFQLGFHEQAFAYFDNALEVIPHSADLLLQVASAHLRLGQHKEALEFYKKALGESKDGAQNQAAKSGLLELTNALISKIGGTLGTFLSFTSPELEQLREQGEMAGEALGLLPDGSISVEKQVLLLQYRGKVYEELGRLEMEAGHSSASILLLQSASDCYQKEQVLNPDADLMGMHAVQAMHYEEFLTRAQNKFLGTGMPKDIDGALGDLESALSISSAPGSGLSSANVWGQMGRIHLETGELDKARSDWQNALKLEPDNAYAQEGRSRLALQYLKEAQRHAIPGAHDGTRSNLDFALENFNQARALDAQNPQIQAFAPLLAEQFFRSATKIRAYVREKSPSESYLLTALSLDPSHYWAHYLLGKSQIISSEFLSARSHLLAAQSYFTSLSADSKERKNYEAACHELAAEFVRHGDVFLRGEWSENGLSPPLAPGTRRPKTKADFYALALERFNWALELDPSNAKALASRSIAQKNLAQSGGAPVPDEFENEMYKAITLNPSNSTAYFEIAGQQLKAGKFDEAVLTVNTLLGVLDEFKENPNAGTDRVRAYALRGEARRGLGQNAQAIADFNSALSLSSDKDVSVAPGALAGIHAKRADAYMALGDFSNARQDYKSAIELLSSSNAGGGELARARFGLGTCYARLGMNDRAEKEWAAAIQLLGSQGKLDSDFMPMVEQFLGLKAGQGETVQVMRALDELLKNQSSIPPVFAEIYFRLSKSLGKAGDVQNQFECINKAIQIDSGSDKTLLYRQARANVLMHAQAYEKALTDLDFIVRAEPDNMQARSARAGIYLRLGQYVQAFDEYVSLSKSKEHSAVGLAGMAEVYQTVLYDSQGETLASLALKESAYEELVFRAKDSFFTRITALYTKAAKSDEHYQVALDEFKRQFLPVMGLRPEDMNANHYFSSFKKYGQISEFMSIKSLTYHWTDIQKELTNLKDRDPALRNQGRSANYDGHPVGEGEKKHQTGVAVGVAMHYALRFNTMKRTDATGSPLAETTLLSELHGVSAQAMDAVRLIEYSFTTIQKPYQVEDATRKYLRSINSIFDKTMIGWGCKPFILPDNKQFKANDPGMEVWFALAKLMTHTDYKHPENSLGDKLPDLEAPTPENLEKWRSLGGFYNGGGTRHYDNKFSNILAILQGTSPSLDHENREKNEKFDLAKYAGKKQKGITYLVDPKCAFVVADVRTERSDKPSVVKDAAIRRVNNAKLFINLSFYGDFAGNSFIDEGLTYVDGPGVIAESTKDLQSPPNLVHFSNYFGITKTGEVRIFSEFERSQMLRAADEKEEEASLANPGQTVKVDPYAGFYFIKELGQKCTYTQKGSHVQMKMSGSDHSTTYLLVGKGADGSFWIYVSKKSETLSEAFRNFKIDCPLLTEAHRADSGGSITVYEGDKQVICKDPKRAHPFALGIASKPEEAVNYYITNDDSKRHWYYMGE